MANFDDLLNHNPAGEGETHRLSKEDYAKKKQEEREETFSLADKTAQEVGADEEAFRSFLNLQARLSRYSAVNALLAFAQNPQATRLGDFAYWKRQGGFIKARQRAIHILEPQAYTKEDGTSGTGYNVKKVFDISQVDGRKLQETSKAHHTERQLLGALIAKAPVEITGVENLPDGLGAMTNPKTGTIAVRKGMDFSDTFRSMAQELAHAHFAARAEHDTDPHFLAHCASYLLCKKYDVDTSAFSFEGAKDVFAGKETQDIKGVLSQIRDACADISDRMERQFEQRQKAEKAQEAR